MSLPLALALTTQEQLSPFSPSQATFGICFHLADAAKLGKQKHASRETSLFMPLRPTLYQTAEGYLKGGSRHTKIKQTILKVFGPENPKYKYELYIYIYIYICIHTYGYNMMYPKRFQAPYPLSIIPAVPPHIDRSMMFASSWKAQPPKFLNT